MALELSGSRTTSSRVRFYRAFHLGRDHRELPAGTYTLHTQEAVYQGVFEPIYLAASIDLCVEEPGRTTTRIASPQDVADALARDRQYSSTLALADENPDRGCASQPKSRISPISVSCREAVIRASSIT